MLDQVHHLTRVTRKLSLNFPGLILGFISILGTLSCNRSSQVSAVPADKLKSVLKVQLTSEPISLDPAEVEDGAGLKLIAELREGLLGYDSQGHLALALAESYRVSKDGKQYQFTLKPNLKWSDGAPLRAQDFVYGIKRALSPKSGGHSADQFRVMSDVREERGHVLIELKEATPYFLQVLTLPAALPVREDALTASGGKWQEKNEPGTGAFRFLAYEPGKHLLLEKNPFYYGKPPSLSWIDFLFIQDESTALNLFEAGALDILTRVPTADIPRLKPSGLLHSDPYFATYYIGFNTKKAPFQDRDFRRAVSGAIHRDELVKGLGTGEQPARLWLPPGIEGYGTDWDDAPFKQSKMKVCAQLKQNSGAPVLVSFDSGARNVQIMEKIQSDVLQELGMKTSLANMDWKSYVRSVQTDPAPIYRMGWQAAFADPMTFLNVFLSDSVNNYSGWKSPTYDQLVAEIRSMEPGALRDVKIRKAQKILVEDEAILAPLFHYVQNHLVSKRVSGFSVNPFGVISFRDMILDNH